MGRMTGEIAQHLDGTLEGDPSIQIHGVEALDSAESGDISFLANPRYAAQMLTTKASAVIVNADWSGSCQTTLIRVKNADAAFAQVAAMILPAPHVPEPGVHAAAVIAEDVELGDAVSIGPCCVIEAGVRVGARTVIGAGCFLGAGSIVGSDSRLHPNVSIGERTEIGNRVILHMGAVIGSDGFGYVPKDGRWEKIPQAGTVQIADDVEIGANTTVDRARFGKTIIAKGAKIDNLVQVAHNVRIGEHTAIAALTGISGSTHIGHNVQIAGSVGLAGHLSVGDGSVIGAMSGVTKDVPPRTFVSGFPAGPHRESQKLQASMRRLPELKKRLLEMEQRLRKLESEET